MSGALFAPGTNEPVIAIANGAALCLSTAIVVTFASTEKHRVFFRVSALRATVKRNTAHVR